MITLASTPFPLEGEVRKGGAQARFFQERLRE
jgi:hypothetical protein